MVEKGKENKGVVEVIILVVVVVVLAVGGYFVWQNATGGPSGGLSVVSQKEVQSLPDEVGQIEQDINVIDTSSIDNDISSIEVELNSALSE